MIAEAVARLRREFDLPVDPARRGPVPLDRFFQEMTAPSVAHVTLPLLSRGGVVAHLRGEGIDVADVGDPAERLEGFLFLAGNAAWAYVSDDPGNPLVRQRFTAAHELGHAVLHRVKIGRYVADRQVSETGETDDDVEREANRFAAELLMPAEVCRIRAEELKRTHGCCPRGVLTYRLAAELLVSRKALGFRLKSLELGDD